MSGTVPGHNEVHSNWALQTQEPPHKRAVPPVVALHPISGEACTLFICSHSFQQTTNVVAVCYE